MSGKKLQGSAVDEELGGALAVGLGGFACVGREGAAYGLVAIGGEDLGVERAGGGREGSKGELAGAAHGVQESSLGSGGAARFGAVEGCDGGVDFGVTAGVFGVERVVGAAGFERERALAGGGGELVDGEALVDGFGAADAVEAGAGEDEGGRLAFVELAQAGVDVSSELYKVQVGAEVEELGAAARRVGADGGVFGQSVERPEGLAYEGVAGVGAGGDGGEGEALIERGGEVFERVDGEVDAAGGERFFDLLDEGALAVRARGDDEAGVLHAVASGADDFNFDGVARGAENGGDVVGLPERELRAPGADTDLGHGSLRIPCEA